MESNENKSLKSNSIAKSIKAVAATVSIGAIGSGFWELILKDLFFSLGNVVLSLLSKVWVGYVDFLHKDIGRLDNDTLILPIYIIFMLFYIFSPWALLVYLLKKISNFELGLKEDKPKRPRTTTEIKVSLNKIRNKSLRLMMPLNVICTLLFLIVCWQQLYVREAGIWAARSIDIVAPYIQNNEHLRLVSELRRVENAEQFYTLHKNITEYAAKAGINLPELNLIGKK